MNEELLREADELLHRRELIAAIDKYNSAELTADKDRCAAGRWLAFMLAGDFEAAWKESDTIRASGSTDPHRFWSGEELSGKRVILRCLHGLGDAVQFFRYVPLLRRIATSLVIEVPPRLVELAAHFDGVDEVITWGDDAPAIPAEWDLQIEVNELPYIFRTKLTHLPIAEKYLKLPRHITDAVRPQPRKPEILKVGVVWASGEWNTSRSVPLKALLPLFNVSGAEYWNLQGGRARTEWSLLEAHDNLHDAEECGENLVPLAALIQQLDLVITSDTLAAHLGGALGVPVCVMLERAADWRWMHERSDSPWYPLLQIFRQERDGEWSPVVAQIEHVLRERVTQREGLRQVA